MGTFLNFVTMIFLLFAFICIVAIVFLLLFRLIYCLSGWLFKEWR